MGCLRPTLIVVVVGLALSLFCAVAHAESDPPPEAEALNDQARALLDKEDKPSAVEAERLYRRALAIVEKALGPDDPEVARSLGRLAWALYAQGRYADMVPVHKRALAIREKAFGANHEDVIDSLDSLGFVYLRLGGHSDEEVILRRRISSISENLFGPDDWRVASALHAEGLLIHSLGRYAEAEALYKRALAVSEKALEASPRGSRSDRAQNVGSILNSMGFSYTEQGRYADAEAVYKRAVAIHEDVLTTKEELVFFKEGNLAASLNDLAELYRKWGRYADAEPLFKRSLSITEAKSGADDPAAGATLRGLAALYGDQGRYAEAEGLLKRSLKIAENFAQGADDGYVTGALDKLSWLYLAQGRYAEAAPLAARGQKMMERLYRDEPEYWEVGQSLITMAEVDRGQRRYAEAEKRLKRGAAILEKFFGPDHPDVARSLTYLSLLYRDQKRYADAEPLLRRALAVREKALGADHPDVAASLDSLADLHRAEGRLDKALPFSRRAVEILGNRFTADRAERSTDSRSAEQRSKRLYFVKNVALVDAVNGADAVEESFRVAQLASASSAGRAVAGMAARFAAGSDTLADVVRQRQDLTAHWQGLDAKIVDATAKAPAERDAAVEASWRAELDKIRAQLDALDARIAREFPQYAELSQPHPLEVTDAQALLAPDEALLVYLTGDDATWLWAVRRDQAARYKIAVGATALAAEVTALRSRLDPDSNPSLKPFPAARAYGLHQTILAPAAPQLAGARQVFVVPDGALESLPIGALVTQPPKADPDKPEDHRAIAWFARDHAVSVLPSVGALRALRRFAGTAHAASPFVGVGNPVLEGTPGSARGVKLASLFRGVGADVDAVRKLTPLPETADELRAVANALKAGDQDLYLAERASEPVLRAGKLDRYRVVHFATHGLMSGDLRGLAEPALVLTPPKQATPENDGLLTASEVATMSFNADWVVLSACNTAASDGTPDAGGLSGLAKAFFYAGARSLLVSHWSVPSTATVKLVTGAFDALEREPAIGRAEALRRAEMAMLDPANPPEFAHPLAWAPFVLAGEGGAGR